MIKQDQAARLMDGGEVVGSDGENIGKIGQVYLDNETGEVSWVTVKTGWFGSGESFVPADQATVNGDTVNVPYDKDKIKDAPHASEAGDAISPEQEDDLYAYYGVGGATAGVSGTDVRTGDVQDADVRTGTADTDLRTGVDADVDRTRAAADTSRGNDTGYLTRSEEQLHVGTRQREAGKARLRKYVVTEQQTVNVPVSHEEVRVVREPMAAGEAPDGATIGEDSVEVTLHQDEVMVNKDVVGVEKVRLDTETVTEQQEVTEQVRKEQVEMGDVEGAGRAGTATDVRADRDDDRTV